MKDRFNQTLNPGDKCIRLKMDKYSGILLDLVEVVNESKNPVYGIRARVIKKSNGNKVLVGPENLIKANTNILKELEKDYATN